MTCTLFPVAKRRAASLCILLAGVVLVAGLTTTTASAQVLCPQANSLGPPIVNNQHIFCGEINGAGNATGFHSRPGGLNPNSVAGGNVTVPVGAPAGIYRLNNFNITQAGVTRVKAFSTMFPDACSQANVLAAIRNAAMGAVAGGAFNGVSGVSCQAGVPAAAFNITGFTNANGDILTAYPNY